MLNKIKPSLNPNTDQDVYKLTSIFVIKLQIRLLAA